MGDKEHNVHFSSASGAGYNNIVIQPMRHGHWNVHLGFLKIHHRYHVDIVIPWNTCVIHPEGNPTVPAMLASDPNPRCRPIDFAQDRDDLRLKVEVHAHKERFLKEMFQIKCCEQGAPLTIYMNARVFDKDQGTPMLRNGIHSVGVEEVPADDDDQDELSE